jgi:hypothetical protein
MSPEQLQQTRRPGQMKGASVIGGGIRPGLSPPGVRKGASIVGGQAERYLNILAAPLWGTQAAPLWGTPLYRYETVPLRKYTVV